MVCLCRSRRQGHCLWCLDGVAALLDDAAESTLVLYDDLGAGTDPLEGAALGCALLEALTRRGSLTVATTHLASIAMVASSSDGFENAAMEYDEAKNRYMSMDYLEVQPASIRSRV